MYLWLVKLCQSDAQSLRLGHCDSLLYINIPVKHMNGLCLFVCRTCKLSNSNFTMASVDILYIDITRRWSGAMSDSREAGKTLCEHAKTIAAWETAPRATKSWGWLRLGANDVLGDNCLSFFVRSPLTLCLSNWNELRSQCDSRDAIRHELFRRCKESLRSRV